LEGALLTSKILMMARPVALLSDCMSKLELLPTWTRMKLGSWGTTWTVRDEWMPGDMPRTTVFWLLTWRVSGL